MQNKNKNEESIDEVDGVKFIDPEEIIESSGIKEGDKIADFGCGPGYFSIPISKIIGEDGEVYAFDVLPAAIEALESQAKINGIDNISIKRVNLEKQKSSKLEDSSVDWVILKHILFQNKDKKTILEEAHRVLKTDGKILVVEWNNNLSVGPDQKLRVDPSDLGELIMNAKFIIEKQLDSGNYHYVIIAGKI
jgi:ubiquinone/menaquinone biosynthesis C-methylase UbiE